MKRAQLLADDQIRVRVRAEADDGTIGDAWQVIDGGHPDYQRWLVYLDREKPTAEKGGPGSGHHGHAGRPGKVGGSKPRGAGPETKPTKEEPEPKAPPSAEGDGDRVVIGVMREGKYVLSGDKPAEAAGIERLLRSFNVDLEDLEHMYALPGAETEISIRMRGEKNLVEITAWWTDPQSGDDMGKAERSLVRVGDKLSCYNNLLEFNEDFRDRGFGTSLYARQISRLRKLGYYKIELLANIDVGRYAWAKMGFNYSTTYETMDHILARTGSNFQYWAEKHSVPVPPGGWPEFTSARGVATYEHRGGYMLNRTEIKGPNIKGGNYHLGKAFMMDKGAGGHGSWSAVLEL